MKKKLNCILLVEDNEADNFFHQLVIQKAGAANHVKITENGREGLDYLASITSPAEPAGKQQFPELILLDINMPVMDGWHFLSEFTARYGNPVAAGTVIILLTTSMNPADIKKAETLLGAGHYQDKPLTAVMLQEIFQRYFPEYV